MFIREITEVLKLYENRLQAGINLTHHPGCIEEITEWLINPEFLQNQESFDRINHIDLVLSMGTKT